jgi:hypothetical protein
MQIAAAIARAAMPDPHTVCSVTLRPYSIGAWLHMQTCQLSFTCGGEHGMGDLLLAVLIGSKTHEDFAGSLRREGIKRELSSLAWRLSGGFRGVWRRRFKRLAYWVCGIKSLRRYRHRFIVHPEEILGFDFQSECRAMETYIAEHGGSPTIVNDWSRPVTAAKASDQPPRAIGSPDEMLLLNALTTEQDSRAARR